MTTNISAKDYSAFRHKENSFKTENEHFFFKLIELRQLNEGEI
jgi:hypothetical protein